MVVVMIGIAKNKLYLNYINYINYLLFSWILLLIQLMDKFTFWWQFMFEMILGYHILKFSMCISIWFNKLFYKLHFTLTLLPVLSLGKRVILIFVISSMEVTMFRTLGFPFCTSADNNLVSAFHNDQLYL